MITLIVLIHQLSFAVFLGAVQLENFFLSNRTALIKPVNGSSAIGHCSNVTIGIGDGESTYKCRAPNSSVLFDGNIPTLIGLDGDMWASQLLTVQLTESQLRVAVHFDFTDTPGYTGVDGVEVVLFNCPQWGIGVRGIVISGSELSTMVGTTVLVKILDNTSCSSVVSALLLHATITLPVLTLEFIHLPGSVWVHLAEVRFIVTTAAQAITTPAITTPAITSGTTPAIMSDTTTPAITTDSTQESKPTNITETSAVETNIGSNLPLTAIILAAVLIGVLITVATVVNLWRCYYAKHQNHRHHPALGHGYTHSHPPPVTLCEETGQAYYSTPAETEREDSPAEYSDVQQETLLKQETPKPSYPPSCPYDVIKRNVNQDSAVVHKSIQDDIGDPGSHAYAVLDGKKQKPTKYSRLKKATGMASTPLAWSIIDTDKRETPEPSNSPSGEYDVIKTKADQGHRSIQDGIRDATAHAYVYAVIDEKTQEEKLKDVACSITDTAKTEMKNTPIRDKSNGTEQDAVSSELAGHVYAIPENKELITPKVGTSIAHVYAVLENQDANSSQVNACTGHAYTVLENEDDQEPLEVDSNGLENEHDKRPSEGNTGYVYAVLERDIQPSKESAVKNTVRDQPHLSVLADTTHPSTPKANTPVNQLYTQVDKKKEDGDTNHLHTPESDQAVSQLYAQVEKKKKDGDTPQPHTSESNTPVDQLYAQVEKEKVKIPLK